MNDERRRRLEALNRDELPVLAPVVAALAPREPPRVAALPRLTTFDPVIAEDSDARQQRDTNSLMANSLMAGEVVESEAGTFYRICRPLTALCQQSAAELAAGAARLVLPPKPVPRPRPEVAAFARRYPQGILFLDLETCGLTGRQPLFLIGLIRQGENKQGENQQGNCLVLEQLLARHLDEERAVLSTLWQIARDMQVLVTFNGRSFDWPFVHARSTHHQLGHDARERVVMPSMTSIASTSSSGMHWPRPELAHLDMLHLARSRWSRQVPNCRLQTLERALLGREREGDIAGRAIPAAYQRFVRTGDARQINSILHHNALDLLSLAQLSLRVLE